MVDINNIRSLESKFKTDYLTDEEKVWADMIGIPHYIRIQSIKALYSLYRDEDNIDLVRKMTRSKTGITDTERKVHEKIIRANPTWQYEVDTPIGSVDFVTDEGALVEVKIAASWKQCAALLLYKRSFDESAPLIAALFGAIVKERTVVDTLNWVGIQVARVKHDGHLEFLKGNISEDGEF